jgi:hypothetical protein
MDLPLKKKIKTKIKVNKCGDRDRELPRGNAD